MKSYKPKQKRGYEAEQNFLDAAKTIFAKEGVERARVSDIVQLAGSSTGNFYFRFKNKEMLFERMFEIYENHARSLIIKLKDPDGSLESVLYFLAALNHKLLQENVGVYKAAHEISTKQPEIWIRFQQLSIETTDRILELSEPYKDQIPFEDWQFYVRRAVQFITGYVANQAIRDSGPAHFGSQDLIDLLFMGSMGVMGLKPPQDFEELQLKINSMLNDGSYD